MAETPLTPREAREPRRQGGRDSSSWILGVLLILLGVAFMLENSGYVLLTGNWWALFIYLAAAASFANVWRSYRAGGEFGKTATGSLIWGLVLTVVASILFFDLLWDQWWPAILVAVGVGIVIGQMFGARSQEPEDTNRG